MIEVKGIVKYERDGHKHVDVMVAEDPHSGYVTHEVGVDVKVNRGKILTFLAALYGVQPGDIVWPDHIVLREGDIE